MLPKLEQDPPDTRLAINTPSNPLPPPKHLKLRFFLYLFFGFIVFIAVCVLGVWGIAYVFHMDIKSFLLNTKSDAYELISKKNYHLLVTPSPTQNTWSIYTNTLQQYTFMYPSMWTIHQDTDESLLLYPPGSIYYANLTQADLGAGIGPKMSITVITRPYIVPDIKHTTVTTNSGITGFAYIDEARSSLPIVDFPFNNGTNILEVQAHNIGQENIDEHLKAHHASLVVQDISLETFNKIVASLQLIQH